MTLPRPEDLHDTDQAAEALGVPAGLIRKWRHLEKAMPAGMMRAAVPGGLKPMWYLDELRPLAAAYHARRGLRHAGSRARR